MDEQPQDKATEDEEAQVAAEAIDADDEAEDADAEDSGLAEEPAEGQA